MKIQQAGWVSREAFRWQSDRERRQDVFTWQWTGGEAAGGQLTGPMSDMNHLPMETLQSSACVEGNVRFFRRFMYHLLKNKTNEQCLQQS